MGVYARSKFICMCECYRCKCMEQVYMYMRVCIGVSACSKFICMCM